MEDLPDLGDRTKSYHPGRESKFGAILIDMLPPLHFEYAVLAEPTAMVMCFLILEMTR